MEIYIKLWISQVISEAFCIRKERSLLHVCSESLLRFGVKSCPIWRHNFVPIMWLTYTHTTVVFPSSLRCGMNKAWRMIVWSVWWLRHKVGGVSSQLLSDKSREGTDYSSITIWKANISRRARSDTIETISLWHSSKQNGRYPLGCLLFYLTVFLLIYSPLVMHYTNLCINYSSCRSCIN